MRHLSPAAYVIECLGGVRAASRALGRSQGSVGRWNLPKERRGLEGGIPRALHAKILAVATEKSLDIGPSDLVLGRETTCSKCGR